MSSSKGIVINTVTVYMAGVKKEFSFPATGRLADLRVAAQTGFKIYGDGLSLIPDGARAEPSSTTKLSLLKGARIRLSPKPGAKYVKVYSANNARADFFCYAMSLADLRRDAARVHGVRSRAVLCELLAVGKLGCVVRNPGEKVTSRTLSSYVVMGTK
ncbi:hypothetical protein H4R18_001655 [Coemansia javaensis]|uniref:Uncharacterized protein n=1 Tax=Coemansia javaensis TaxID=2761396 RepID=A0A9W8HC48_9FUNG|nr:hypothetical protein H4R18_001655 [Coemansia javaensis]